MNWQVESESLMDGRCRRLIFSERGHRLSYAQWVDALTDEPEYRRFFSRCLADMPFKAFFWETPPVNRDSINRPFECVLTDAPRLYAVPVAPLVFADYFARACESGSAVSFDNLGKDARLVAPCPLEPIEACSHLAAFVRRAPDACQQAFWTEVAIAFRQGLGGRPLWLSTCGSGVYWLHVRLDSWPKYYSYTPYTSWSG